MLPQKDKTLAQVESEVMSLTYRACDIYPPGESRTMARDFEFFNTLMRCLPTKGSELVRREHGDLSTMLPKLPTATELSIGLHNLRHMINRDIQKKWSRALLQPLKTGNSKRENYTKTLCQFWN